MLVDYNHKLSLTTSNNYVVWLPRFWVFFTAMIDVKEQTCGLFFATNNGDKSHGIYLNW